MYYRRVEVGDTFGESGKVITTLDYSHTDAHNNRHFVFQCYCGNEFTTAGFRLNSGHTKSCGCLRTEHAISKLRTVDPKERTRRALKGWETKRKQQ